MINNLTYRCKLINFRDLGVISGPKLTPKRQNRAFGVNLRAKMLPNLKGISDSGLNGRYPTTLPRGHLNKSRRVGWRREAPMAAAAAGRNGREMFERTSSSGVQGVRGRE